ncbi:hypothetical protein [Alterisphingorhabdus coralli]|uniref:Uncharacterized protein n=1 Tax=Alterisphingorhabdus coralli TaxID=3071408 RepID=A0AA97I3E8_9SPHN|nr:hypothetical protein [Parasphingorhabdus sp. SCSIO 66989]WOE76730.1 hypothetical protein RB602_15200 [Parasphingorhabdus sp. SCSIO 66989]
MNSTTHFPQPAHSADHDAAMQHFSRILLKAFNDAQSHQVEKLDEVQDKLRLSLRLQDEATSIMRELLTMTSGQWLADFLARHLFFTNIKKLDNVSLAETGAIAGAMRDHWNAVLEEKGIVLGRGDWLHLANELTTLSQTIQHTLSLSPMDARYD